jgi:hypothetical protein
MSNGARHTSAYTWIETHPTAVRGALLGGALAAAVGWMVRASKDRQG